jgi:hypothetical protein
MITLLHSSRQCDFTDCDRAIFERIGVRSRRIYAAADRRDAEMMFFCADCANEYKLGTMRAKPTGDMSHGAQNG